MKDYAAFTSEYRRFMILRLLADFPGWRGNADVLQMALVDLRYDVSYKAVLEDLRHLAGLGLITLDAMPGPMGELLVATLSRAGGDVAAGRDQAKGVRRPLSGALPGAVI